MRWSHGDRIVRREVLNDGRPWEAMGVYVVEDTDEHLVTYLPADAELGFPPGTDFPTDTGLHPWNTGRRWQGHGVLMVQRPGDDHAVWHFWEGADRAFSGWYINIQEAFVRTPIGYDTQDLELDIEVALNGEWRFKDRELMAHRVLIGRYTQAQVHRVLALGDALGAELEAGRRWWDPSWSTWTPDPEWQPIPLPAGWEHVPAYR
jgi:hypothetical protein